MDPCSCRSGKKRNGSGGLEARRSHRGDCPPLTHCSAFVTPHSSFLAPPSQQGELNAPVFFVLAPLVKDEVDLPALRSSGGGAPAGCLSSRSSLPGTAAFRSGCSADRSRCEGVRRRTAGIWCRPGEPRPAGPVLRLPEPSLSPGPAPAPLGRTVTRPSARVLPQGLLSPFPVVDPAGSAVPAAGGGFPCMWAGPPGPRRPGENPEKENHCRLHGGSLKKGQCPGAPRLHLKIPSGKAVGRRSQGKPWGRGNGWRALGQPSTWSAAGFNRQPVLRTGRSARRRRSGGGCALRRNRSASRGPDPAVRGWWHADR